MLLRNGLSTTKFRMAAAIERSGDRALPILAAALILLVYVVGGEGWLLGVSMLLPSSILLFKRHAHMARYVRDPHQGFLRVLTEDAFDSAVTTMLRDTSRSGRKSAYFLFNIEDLDAIRKRFGSRISDDVTSCCVRRLCDALREDDVISQIEDGKFAIVLAPTHHLTMESCIQMAARIQSSLEEPILLSRASIFVSCAVGFATSHPSFGSSAEALRSAAQIAMAEASRANSSAIRAYSNELRQKSVSRRKAENEASHALERGEIKAWFQPQISTDTGRLSGLEALARWEHPTRGLLPPSEFLPMFERTGQMEALAKQMLDQSLCALQVWDDSGVSIPQIGVNFSADELRNPSLPEMVKWELDRFDLAPSRLAIEIIENVIAGSPDDIVARNVTELCKLGCPIDLDDFGTGHASISSIRHLPITRLKIDRSFVTQCDQDSDQRRMIAAILTMAERLGLDTLAEGVETAGEHAILSQLGCSHVQGFGISRPLAPTSVIAWLHKHNAKLQTAPQIGKKAH